LNKKAVCSYFEKMHPEGFFHLPDRPAQKKAKRSPGNGKAFEMKDMFGLQAAG
jgi:hypothetical protein